MKVVGDALIIRETLCPTPFAVSGDMLLLDFNIFVIKPSHTGVSYPLRWCFTHSSFYRRTPPHNAATPLSITVRFHTVLSSVSRFSPQALLKEPFSNSFDIDITFFPTERSRLQ